MGTPIVLVTERIYFFLKKDMKVLETLNSPRYLFSTFSKKFDYRLVVPIEDHRILQMHKNDFAQYSGTNIKNETLFSETKSDKKYAKFTSHFVKCYATILLNMVKLIDEK